MKRQREDTYLSQAIVAAQSAAAYDTNVKFLLADKQILARILKYTIWECGDKDYSHRVELVQGILINIRSDPGEETSRNALIAMLEVLLSEMNVEEKKDILEKEYGMVMQVETEGRMQSMCNLSEVFIEKGIQKGTINQSRQSIVDLLEDLGDIPEDIVARILAEEDTETLRIWHKAAARTEGFAAFRETIMNA